VCVADQIADAASQKNGNHPTALTRFFPPHVRRPAPCSRYSFYLLSNGA
jgi:hypothetical protein